MMSAEAAFYFDLSSPRCYLAAEQVMRVFGPRLEWVPVLAQGRSADQETTQQPRLEGRARELGMQPLRWPREFPFDSERAMLAATYATQIGRGVAFAQAAFRQAFAGGHSLAEDDYVLIAAAACEMHPAAVLRALERRGVHEQLANATAESLRAGVSVLPAVRDGERVLYGDELLTGTSAQPAGALAR
jgi:2-hydroxychromene-2-carboxylate isomerase